MKYFFRIVLFPLFLVAVVLILLGICLVLLYVGLSKLDWIDKEYSGY